MFKKLQNLLFEEEIDDDEETGEIEVQPVKEQPVQVKPEPVPVKKEEPAPVIEQPAPVQKPQPVEEKKTTMQRIDVTQAVPVIESARPQAPKSESVFREPAVSQPRPQETAPVSKPATLGITIDDVAAERKAAKPAPKPAPKPAVKPAKQETKSVRPAYQFQPVISPIFGVDEKDMNALKTTTSKISEQEKAKTDKNVSPIISPMYGTNQEDIPSSIQKTVEKSNQQEVMMVTPEKKAAEDEIPEFSLDDILRTRDEEIETETKKDPEATDSLFPNLNLWDDEDETVVIERPSLDLDSTDKE